MPAPNYISIDTVYQRVLALANKEQRGYITPQEFNLMANQAQKELFEQYFYELNLQEKGESEAEVGSFGDMVDLIREKLKYFTSFGLMVYDTTRASWQIPPFSYRTGRIFYNGREPKMGDANDMYNLQKSKWHKEVLTEDPIMKEYAGGWKLWDSTGEVTSFSSPPGVVHIEVISQPPKVEWGYVVVNEQALYNATTSTHFELHESEETDLVIKILELAGIVIQKPELQATAAQEESQNAQEENK